MVTIFCAWMAALGFNWDQVADGMGSMPATGAILGIVLLATCPPPCVLGMTVLAALVGWKLHLLQGALWMSLWTAASLAATFYTCCSVALEWPLTADDSDEHAQGIRGSKDGLHRVGNGIAYAMHIPSSIAMNFLWSLPSTLTVLPRSLMLVLFEMVSLVLFSTGHLLILFCRRCGVGLRHHGMSSKNGEQGPLHTDSSRTPVILVSAKGGHAAWFVPRLNFLSKSHLFGPVLVFESVGGVDAGIREAAEELQNFILDALPHEAPTEVILVGHSVGGLISAYFADVLAPKTNIKVGSVMCISTPWAGLHRDNGFRGRLLSSLQRGLLGLQNLSGKMMADLVAESPVLEQIQDFQIAPASGCKECRARFYNLAGTLDVVLAGGSRHIARRNAFWCCMLPHVGHSSILLSRTVWEQVFVWLQAYKDSVRKRPPGHTCACAHAQVDTLAHSGATQLAAAQSLHVHALANTHAHSHPRAHFHTHAGAASHAASNGNSASHTSTHTSHAGGGERMGEEEMSARDDDGPLSAEGDGPLSAKGDGLLSHPPLHHSRPSAHAHHGEASERGWAGAVCSGRNEPGSPFKGHRQSVAGNRPWIPPLSTAFSGMWSWNPGSRADGTGTGSESV